MKPLQNCSKFVCWLCFFAAMCIFYVTVFGLLEGKITLVKINSSRGKDLNQTRDVKFEDRSTAGGVKDDDNNANSDDWGNSDESKMLPDEKKISYSPNRFFVNQKLREFYGTSSETLLKIFDFNHRNCCPLNYSFVGCEYSACAFTEDADEAVLVMINGARLGNLPLPRRQPGQIWLMYTKEPPTFKRFNYLVRNDFKDEVNWTRCIFRDSTFRGHYGSLESRPPPDNDYDKIFALKKYQVAWFASHCNSQSRRDEYVQRMRSEIDVHIFGKCGDRSCGHYGLKLKLLGCLDLVSTDYKFYLAFENSLCSDYVTEKFYKLFEDVNVIPVVRGGANYSELAPAGTYINAKDFSSPEDLGRYLNKLSKNKKEYLHMLQLKNRYTNTFPKPRYPCELCKALHTRRHIPSTYSNILTWLSSHCWEANDL